MPIQHAIWKVGATPEALPFPNSRPRKTLRPSSRRHGDDFLGLDADRPAGQTARRDHRLGGDPPDGSLVLIELKRDKRRRVRSWPALDYASWMEKLKPDKIARI